MTAGFSLLLLALVEGAGSAPAYPWLVSHEPSQSLAVRIPPPPGSRRIALTTGSFGHWLRSLPLRSGRPAVRLFDGRPKANQEAHHAVLDIDVGTRDLQQCADAVIRLRAEYLYAAGAADTVAFDFTSGHRVPFSRWARGERPVVAGAAVRWKPTARADASHPAFRRYLDTVFTYAGSYSLARELKPTGELIEPGDVFIQGAFPGHAVLVVDVAEDVETRRRYFLLVQSYMPAQDVHVLRHPDGAATGPWYAADFGRRLVTPEWTFERSDRRRF